MVQVPRVPSVNLQPIATPALQAPRPVVMQDQRYKEAAALAGATGELAQASFRMDAIQKREDAQRAREQLKVQNQLDDADAKRLDNLFADQIRQTLTDYGNTIGRPAIDSRDDVVKKLADTQESLLKSAKNPIQRTMVEDAFNRRFMTARASIDDHYNKQAKNTAFGEAKARAELAQTDYTRNITADPQTAVRDWNTMLSEVDALGDLQGLAADSAERRRMRLDVTDKTHALVFKNLMREERIDEATQYANFVSGRKDEIKEETLAEIKGIMENAQSNKKLRDLLSSPAMFNMDQDAQLNTAFQLRQDGKLNEEEYGTLTKAIYSISDAERERNAQVSASTLQKAVQFMRDNPGKTVLNMNPVDLQELRRTGMLPSLQNYDPKLGDWRTDRGVVVELENMPASQLTAMSDAELFVKYRAKLNEKDFNYIRNLKTRMAGKALDQDQTSFISARQQLNALADKAGMDKKGAEFEQLVENLDKNVQFYRERITDGRALTDQEEKEIVNDTFAANVERKGTLYNSKVKLYGESLADIYSDPSYGVSIVDPNTQRSTWFSISEIPATELEEIRVGLHEHNRRVKSGKEEGLQIVPDTPDEWAKAYLRKNPRVEVRNIQTQIKPPSTSAAPLYKTPGNWSF